MFLMRCTGAVLGKNIGGMAPNNLGGNNEQNCCVQLASIKQLIIDRNYPENLRGSGQDLGEGACAPLAPA